MKTDPIQRQPPKQRIQTSEPPLNPKTPSRHRPPDAHMNHVHMCSSRTSQKFVDAPRLPWLNLIEEVQPHSGAFESEAAKFQFGAVQLFRQQVDFIIGERQVISAQERFSNLLQPLPRRSADKMKLTPRKTRFRGRNTQQFLQNGSHKKSLAQAHASTASGQAVLRIATPAARAGTVVGYALRLRLPRYCAKPRNPETAVSAKNRPNTTCMQTSNP